jgi:uncharacterized membrane protein YphA (DoxX/SURF4 family)
MLPLRNHCIEETIMNILLIVHSGLRWLILIIAVSAIIKFLIGWLQHGQHKGMDRGLMSGFTGLMDLQAALGTVLLLWSGLAGDGFPFFRIAHALIMIAAGVVAHMSRRWKDADDATRFRNNLFLIVGSLILILIGISILPGGLSR